MNKTVYVAFKRYFSGDFLILGVYYSPDDAKRRCDEAEEDVNCSYADYEWFEIQ